MTELIAHQVIQAQGFFLVAHGYGSRGGFRYPAPVQVAKHGAVKVVLHLYLTQVQKTGPQNGFSPADFQFALPVAPLVEAEQAALAIYVQLPGATDPKVQGIKQHQVALVILHGPQHRGIVVHLSGNLLISQELDLGDFLLSAFFGDHRLDGVGFRGRGFGHRGGIFPPGCIALLLGVARDNDFAPVGLARDQDGTDRLQLIFIRVVFPHLLPCLLIGRDVGGHINQSLFQQLDNLVQASGRGIGFWCGLLAKDQRVFADDFLRRRLFFRSADTGFRYRAHALSQFQYNRSHVPVGFRPGIFTRFAQYQRGGIRRGLCRGRRFQRKLRIERNRPAHGQPHQTSRAYPEHAEILGGIHRQNNRRLRRWRPGRPRQRRPFSHE
jgi:hypothetical protein